jgi:hypothetical protein
VTTASGAKAAAPMTTKRRIMTVIAGPLRSSPTRLRSK